MWIVFWVLYTKINFGISVTNHLFIRYYLMKGGDFIMLLRKSFIILITILALSATGIPVDAQSDISRYDLGSNRIIQPYYTNILTF